MTGLVDSLPILILYPHARCNCRCIMCDIWRGTDSLELSAEDLERHLTDIEKLAVRWVVFSGGEPLMHSDLFRLSAMLRLLNIRVTILSTGLLLKRHARVIVDNIDDVTVSLDGPDKVHDGIRRTSGAFAVLTGGVKAIHEMNPDFKISARCTVQRSNFNCLRETARAAKDIGISSISFLAADLASDAFNRSQPWNEMRQAEVALTVEEVAVLKRELEGLHSDWNGTGFVSEGRSKLDRIGQHFRAHLGLCEPVAPQCNAPWVSAVVETDGTVRPCFFHRPIGTLKSHTLLQVLNGFEAQQFRRSLRVETNEICRRCVCSLNLRPRTSFREGDNRTDSDHTLAKAPKLNGENTALAEY
jgi:Fe-coproporphyrin III synthase